jgi:2,5-diketo-D-gluconate reductase B
LAGDTAPGILHESAKESVMTAHKAEIPAIGLGTWELRGRLCARIVEQALRLGYRHIDTAEIYDNEREVGEGLRASGLRRDDVFVTTKVWPAHFSPPELERAAKESLSRLRLTEVDLLLLHWPSPKIPLSETIGALCKVKRAGMTKNIGLSNFTGALLDEAVKLSTEPLICNQIKVHPFIDQSAAIAASKAYGMTVVAHTPIAKGAAKRDAVLTRIGEAHGKTAVQVGLRYLLQQELVVIPRTSKVERLSENFDLFDFELSPQEMAEIAQLARPDGSILS